MTKAKPVVSDALMKSLTLLQKRSATEARALALRTLHHAEAAREDAANHGRDLFSEQEAQDALTIKENK